MHNKFLFANQIADGSSTAQTESHVFNFAKLMSSQNRKHYPNVDRSGNAQLYTIAAKLYGTSTRALITAAPNCYYVGRAIKAWHDARVKMYSRAGIWMRELGPYARHLRPYLDVNHENATTVEIDTENAATLGVTPNFQGDEWTYSRAAVTTPMESGPLTSDIHMTDLIDSYSFTILGDSVTEDVTADSPDESTTITDQDSFVSVGMVAEWLDSFKLGATVSGAPVDADNALLQLVIDSTSSEEVLELAEDAIAEARPWDKDGSQYATAVLAGYLQAKAGYSDTVIFEAPCGLFNLGLENSHTQETLYVDFEVLGIRDM